MKQTITFDKLKNKHFQSQFEDLKKQKHEEIHNKVEKSIEKQKHILQLQKQLEMRLRQKNQFIMSKMNKSIQLKSKSVEKIQNKIKLRLKWEQEKYQGHKKKQKNYLLRSWRQSVKLAEWVNQRSQFKKNRSSSTVEKDKLKTDEDIDEYNYEEEHRQQTLPRIKESKKGLFDGKKTDYRTTTYNKNDKSYQIIARHKQSPSYVEKIREVAEKKEQQEIKKFNFKLLKVQQARMKKQKLQKQRQKKIKSYIEFKQQRMKSSESNHKVNSSKNHKRVLTISDSPQDNKYETSKVSGLFQKWEEENKAKQSELFKKRIERGNQYLEALENKSIRKKMVKQLEMNSIEKKLYLERQRLHQLKAQSNKEG